MRISGILFTILALFLLAGQSQACETYEEGLGQDFPEGPREYWYGASQGSRLMPDAWYRALTRADDGTNFAARANMERYGFDYCDDKALDPIGFVLDQDELRPTAIGLTCAACHTGRITDGTSSFLVHGGTATMDFQPFTHDLFQAMLKVRVGPFDKAANAPDFLAFSQKILGADATPEARKALHGDISAWLQYRRDIQASIDDGGQWGHGRQDAVQVIFNTVATLSDSKIKGGLPASTAPVSIPSVWLAPHTARVQWNGSAFKAKDLGLAGPISTGAMIRNISEVIGVFADIKLPDYATLATANYVEVKSSVRLGNLIRLERALAELTPPKWPAAWGAIDRNSADYLAGAALYTQHCAACHARIDPAHPLGEIGDATGLAMVADPLAGKPFVRVVNAFDLAGEAGPVVGTDPMMVCNSLTHAAWSGKMTAFTDVFEALQSFALQGASGVKVVRFPGGTQTLHLIEDLSVRILWEKRGEVVGVQVSDIYKKTADFFGWFTGGAVQVAGDEWVIGQAQKVVTPLPVTHHLKTLDEVRRVCSEQLAVQRKTAPDTAAPGYKAGPLAGIFASAPYLHNGSVPTLDALLLPPDLRPKRFLVGQVLFDPVKVGLGAARAGGLVNEFSVEDSAGAVIPGDFNGGHAYPAVALTEPERAQLIAYLKGL